MPHAPIITNARYFCATGNRTTTCVQAWAIHGVISLLIPKAPPDGLWNFHGRRDWQKKAFRFRRFCCLRKDLMPMMRQTTLIAGLFPVPLPSPAFRKIAVTVAKKTDLPCCRTPNGWKMALVYRFQSLIILYGIKKAARSSCKGQSNKLSAAEAAS